MKGLKRFMSFVLLLSLVFSYLQPIVTANAKEDKTETVKNNKKNKKNKKKNKKSNKKKSNKKKKQKKIKKDYTSENKEIAIHLEQSQGWALGKLDGDGNPTDNGVPDPGNNWSIVISKIELSSEDDQLNIYVIPEFSNLSKAEKDQVINTCQNVSTSYLGETKPLFTVVFDGDKTIGRSKVTDVKEIKWVK